MQIGEHYAFYRASALTLLCKPCSSHRRDGRPSVRLTVCYTLALSENDVS